MTCQECHIFALSPAPLERDSTRRALYTAVVIEKNVMAIDGIFKEFSNIKREPP